MDSDIILAEMLPIKYRQSKEASGPYYMPIGLPSQVTCTSALPGDTGNPEIMSFHLDVACFLPKKTKHSLKYHLAY